MVFCEKRDDLVLKDFVDSYVDEAVSCVRGRKMPLCDFNHAVHINVAENFGLLEEQVAGVHRSFHWAFFSNDEGCQSPFSLFWLDSKRDGVESDGYYVSLKDENVDGCRELSDYLVGRYGNYIRVRASLEGFSL